MLESGIPGRMTGVERLDLFRPGCIMAAGRIRIPRGVPPMTMTSLLLTGLAIAAGYFFLTWLISVRIKNYGLLDAAWSYGVAILAPFYAWMGPGDATRKWTMTALGVAWSLRLGTYILRRVISHHPAEDARYQTLRARWPGSGMFLLFFQLQAVLVVIFSLPFLLMAFNPEPGLKTLEITGLAIALLSLGGESLADAQMKAFKAHPGHKGKVCQNGLWRYSRHPNYFFESLHWIAYVPLALGYLILTLPVAWLSHWLEKRFRHET